MRPNRRSVALPRLRAELASFRRAEDGSLTIFGVYLAILIFMLGGIAVDVMRSEQVRTAVQNVEDTAVLAATNLNQSLDAESVVKDYFAKAGMANYLKSVTVTSSANYKQVSAVATTTVPTYFMKLEGIDTLNTQNDSTAVQSIGNVEIALALDNSGSMSQAMNSSDNGCTTNHYNRYHWGGYSSCTTTSKIDGLKTAADAFVDTMFNKSAAGTITMSIFPYDAHVNIGNDLLQYLNVSNEQTQSKCVDFQASDFTSTAVDPTATLQRAGYADLRGNTSNINSSDVECNTSSNRDSIVYSADPTALKNTIDNMTAGGWTSIDSGVKWAAASLDPAWQPVVNDMINDGKLSSAFAGRPVSYSDNSNMKVLIVMSDGENTTRYQLKPGYYSGGSNLYTNSADTSNYSFYDPGHGTTPWFWTADNSWHNKVFASGGGDYTSCTYSYWHGTTCTTKTASGTATELTYPQLWAKWSVKYFLNQIIVPGYGSSAYNTWYDNMVDAVSSTTMDSYLHTMCSTAKNNGVIIYAIGFQTSSHGAATLQDCATAPSYYFNAQGTEISTVFAKIATSIEHLRLTQ
jgi:Flp pilus assembly protein TadG